MFIFQRKTYEFDFEDRHYVLKEPSEAAHLAFRQGQIKEEEYVGEERRLQFNQEVVLKSPLVLLSKCVYNGDGKLVDYNTIADWPHRLTDHLFDKAREMAEMGSANTVEGIDSEIKRLTELRKELEESTPKN